MATINIGSLTFTHKGDYASGTTYAKNDVVYYSTNGNAYIAKQATTGNAPTSTAHWDVFAAGSGGIWNAGLSLGSANQSVRVNSGGNALEFAAASSGKLKQIVNGYWENGGSEWTTTSQSFVDTPLTFNITPTASTSKILVSFVTNGSRSNSTSNNAIFTIKRAISGGATTDLGSGSTYALAHTYSPNPSIQTLQKVDAPNTTSQITYTVQAKSDGGTADLARRSSQSTYYAIEIGA